MDKRKVLTIKEGLQPFLGRLEELNRPLHIAYINPLLPSTFILEVQAEWIDEMSMLKAIQFLHATLRACTDKIILKSMLAIRVVNMKNDIEFEKPYYVLVAPLAENVAA